MKAKTGIVIAAALGAYLFLGKRGTQQSSVVDPSTEADAQATLDRLLGDWSVLDAIGREVPEGESFPVRFVEGPYRMIFLDPSGNPSTVVQMDVAEAGNDRVVAARVDPSPTAIPLQITVIFLDEDDITLSLLRDGEEITYTATRIPGGFVPARVPPPVMPSAPSRRYGAKGASTDVSRVSSLQERALSPNPILSARGPSRVAVGASTATAMQATSFSWRDYGPIPDLGLPVRRPWAPDEKSLLLRAFNNWATEAQRYGVQPGIYREPFMRAFSAGDYFTAQRIFSEATHAEAAFMDGTRGRTMTGTGGGCGCGCGGACGCGGGQGCSGPMKGCGCGG